MAKKPIRRRGKEPMPGQPDTRNWYAHKKHMGVLIDDCLGTSDERLAMRRLDDLLREVERGEYQTGKKLFEKACDHYEAAVLKKRSESVQELHAGVIRNHLVPEFRGRKLSEIDQMDVLKYFQKHAEVCESTLKKRFRVLKEIMRMKNPMYELPPMQFKNKGRRFDESQILELEDVKRIADSVHPPYRPMCLVAAYSGLRLGNIVALQKRNVDLKDGWIKVRQTKTGKPVSVPICEALASVFRRHKISPAGAFDRFFPDVKPKAVSTCVGRTMKRLGYPWASFHHFRHFAACYLVNNGVPLEVIQKFMGHDDLRSTLIYARLKKDKIQEAVSVFDRHPGKV